MTERITIELDELTSPYLHHYAQQWQKDLSEAATVWLQMQAKSWEFKQKVAAAPGGASSRPRCKPNGTGTAPRTALTAALLRPKAKPQAIRCRGIIEFGQQSRSLI